MRPNPVEITGLTFGTFAEVSALNRRFIPGHPRLKLTVDLDLSARVPGATPALFMPGLSRLLPSLERHTCCGHGRIEDTFISGTRVPTCLTEEPDDAIEIAHLLEHLIIDFQHGVADMRSCSGITCGYKTPITRYDLFVETPDERVGRFCVSLACELMNRLLLGEEPFPSCASVLNLARRVFLAAGASLTSPVNTLGDDTHAADALRRLLASGFLTEVAMAINFSGVPLYGFNAIAGGSITNRS